MIQFNMVANYTSNSIMKECQKITKLHQDAMQTLKRKGQKQDTTKNMYTLWSFTRRYIPSFPILVVLDYDCFAYDVEGISTAHGIPARRSNVYRDTENAKIIEIRIHIAQS